MENGVRIGSNSKGTLPRMANLIDQPIAAALAHNQGHLFVHIFLQLLGVRLFDFIEQAPQLLINSFARF